MVVVVAEGVVDLRQGQAGQDVRDNGLGRLAQANVADDVADRDPRSPNDGFRPARFLDHLDVGVLGRQLLAQQVVRNLVRRLRYGPRSPL